MVAQMVGAVQRGAPGRVGFDEGEGARGLGQGGFGGAHTRSVQTPNEEPQPQVVFAFGLRITNCAPCRLSV